MQAELNTSLADKWLNVNLTGSWKLDQTLPDPQQVTDVISGRTGIEGVAVTGQEVADWDSGLLTFLVRIHADCESQEIAFKTAALPQGVKQLLDLAFAVPERTGARRVAKQEAVATQIGQWAIAGAREGREGVTFLGEVFVGFGRMMAGRARFRRSDLWLFIQEAGAQALPIVSLISLLVGVILAFIGAVQLAMFSAEIYVANLVGLGMAREMGAMMTGIIMAGRTGASYAAQLGTMQLNEEIDALRTLGVPPMEFLVLPRMLALTIMMPMLTIYSDLLGILGGAVIGIGMFDITPTQYITQTAEGVPLKHFAVGLFKGAIYGVIVALAGCFKGIQCGRSASAVGEATTSAVVTSIVWIIVSCALLTVVTHVLGI